MITIIGLDPALNSCGLAIVRDGELVAAVRMISDAKLIRLPIGARCDEVAARLVHWLNGAWVHVDRDVTLVYEWPQIYSVGKSKGDPNDLLALAAIGAAVARALPATLGCRINILTPTPREWQGGTSKSIKGDPWISTRGYKLKARLTPAEIERIPNSHDAIDAVGLALHATDRALAIQRRVYPGASPRRT